MGCFAVRNTHQELQCTSFTKLNNPNRDPKKEREAREFLVATLNHGRHNSITPALNSRYEKENRIFAVHGLNRISPLYLTGF
jgi:hypothetical protein